MTQLATTTKPAPASAPKPSAETIRQAVLADQAAALKDAANRQPAQGDGKAKPATKNSKVKAAKPAKAKTAKADTRKITVVAKTNPHAAGSKRAGGWPGSPPGLQFRAAGVQGQIVFAAAASGPDSAHGIADTPRAPTCAKQRPISVCSKARTWGS